MTPRFWARFGLAVLTACGLVSVSACQWGDSPQPAPPNGQQASSAALPGPKAKLEELKDEIPAAELAAVMSAHFAGVGAMEQYEYARAVAAFRDVQRRAPGWIPGAINLAIALLNDSGDKAEEAKKKGAGEGQAANFDEALDLLARVLDARPNNPYAHFCRGIIRYWKGELVEAHRHFQRVVEIDSDDAAGWYWLAATVSDEKSPGMSDVRQTSKMQVPLLEKVLERNPYLASALYRLSMAYRIAGEPQKAVKMLASWKDMQIDRPSGPPGPGEELVLKYGTMGKYASVVNPFQTSDPAADPVPPPRFAAPRAIDVKLAAGERWAASADFQGTQSVIARIRARFARPSRPSTPTMTAGLTSISRRL